MADLERSAVDSQAGNSRKRTYSTSVDSTSGSESSNADDGMHGDYDNDTEQTVTVSLQLPSPAQTPKRSKKRVRFSDPGLSMRGKIFNGSTGLTPAMQRTSVGGRQQIPEPQTPSRRSSRRRSAPSTLPNILIDPVLPGPINVQFTPLSQILDSRTRRRLWRSGLSEEMNNIESDKKEIKKAKTQINALSKELESYRSMETGVHDFSCNFDTMPIDDYTMNDSVLLSNSPVFHLRHATNSADDLESPVSIYPETPNTDSSIQVSILDDQCVDELQNLSEDLSAARKEKQDLFNEWRKLNTPQVQPESQTESPPSGFMQQIVPTLESALRRASDANQALETVQNDLTSMGFSGASIEDILTQIRECFHSARLELEYILPGQTTTGLADGKATIDALVKRIKQSYNAFISERKRADSLSDSHRAIKKQFDLTLEHLQKERERVKKLEETADASAEDMLHIRMRIQELESEVADKATIIERFNHALKKYHEESKNFEAIIEKMEEEKIDDDQIAAARIATLEISLSDKAKLAAEYLARYEILEETNRKKDIEIENISTSIELLEAENRELMDSLTKRDQEIGRLNVRYSQEMTTLQSTTVDLEKLRRVNELLEAHSKQEAESRLRLEKWFSKVVQSSQKVFRTECQNAEVRQTEMNQLLSDDLPSEPSLPTNSPSKTSRGMALENIRVGRGKDRRMLDSDILGRDSGIGLSTDNTNSEVNNLNSSDGVVEEM